LVQYAIGREQGRAAPEKRLYRELAVETSIRSVLFIPRTLATGIFGLIKGAAFEAGVPKTHWTPLGYARNLTRVDPHTSIPTTSCSRPALFAAPRVPND
jgi:hypothetical protein